MSKLSKQILISATVAALNTRSYAMSMYLKNDTYDTRPKNYWRGGSVGKGGKIKYPRR